jgi:hypothetical protein
MNAMAEARMVAARIQRPLDFEQGAAAGRDRITLSSQGSRKRAHISGSISEGGSWKLGDGSLELGETRQKLRSEVRAAPAFDWHC